METPSHACLHIDGIQAEAFFIDHAVYAPVARGFRHGADLGTGAAVAHRQEEIDDELLKEAGGLRHNALQQLGGEMGILS